MASPELKATSTYEIIPPPLGGGAYGIVFKIRMKKTKKLYALKQISFSEHLDQEGLESELQKARQEYSLLRRNMKNVVCAYGSYFDSEQKKFCFSMDLYEQNLTKYIYEFNKKNGRSMTVDEFLPIFKNIITGT